MFGFFCVRLNFLLFWKKLQPIDLIIPLQCRRGERQQGTIIFHFCLYCYFSFYFMHRWSWSFVTHSALLKCEWGGKDFVADVGVTPNGIKLVPFIIIPIFCVVILLSFISLSTLYFYVDNGYQAKPSVHSLCYSIIINHLKH